MKYSKEKGITLIALVITIIVLLILAGVSISMLTGENGLLSQAQKAKTETENAAEDETGKLDRYNYIVDSYANGEKPSEIEPGEIVESGSGNKEYNNNGYTAKIPEGFMIVPGCSDITQGLVISDDPGDTEKDSSNVVANGNQFVWIPVTSSEQYVRNTEYNISNQTLYMANVYTGNDYLPDEIQPNIPESVTDSKEIGALNDEAERTAVVNAGGFYISRYEMAKDEDENLVSKKGTFAYFKESIAQLKSLSKNFNTNSSNLKSALCSGIQWDVMMDLIKEKTGFDVNVVHDECHTGKQQATGTNPDDKVFNIYDLEGNCLEYTSEEFSFLTTFYIERSGRPMSPIYPASARITGGDAMTRF